MSLRKKIITSRDYRSMRIEIQDILSGQIKDVDGQHIKQVLFDYCGCNEMDFKDKILEILNKLQFFTQGTTVASMLLSLPQIDETIEDTAILFYMTTTTFAKVISSSELCDNDSQLVSLQTAIAMYALFSNKLSINTIRQNLALSSDYFLFLIPPNL